MSAPAPTRRGTARLAVPLTFVRDCLERFVRLQGFDRATALAGQAFTALIPLLIVYAAVVPQPDGEDFADRLIHKLDLSGAAARTVREAFAPAGTVEDTATALGVLLLIFAALAFTRGMQRLYQLAFDLPAMGMRGTPWGLLWLLCAAGFITVRPILTGLFGGGLEIVVSLAAALVLWLVTPYVLLARRLSFARLVPAAALAATGMTALAVSSVLWLPRTVSSSAEQFGFIGVAFALLSWLVAGGFILVAAAGIGAVIDERRQR